MQNLLSRMPQALLPGESGHVRPVFIMVRFVCTKADNWISVIDQVVAYCVQHLLYSACLDMFQRVMHLPVCVPILAQVGRQV